MRLVQFVIQGHLTFRIHNFYDKTTQNLKLVLLKTFKWSSFGLLKATKLVIVRSSFCNFSMNTKPGNTGAGMDASVGDGVIPGTTDAPADESDDLEPSVDRQHKGAATVSL